jgi:hypothetical protein
MAGAGVPSGVCARADGGEAARINRPQPQNVAQEADNFIKSMEAP